MNIFRLDDDPGVAARWHCNQHVGKMMLEAAQMLSSVHWAHGYSGPNQRDDGNGPYKAHPTVNRWLGPYRWIEQSINNYRWTVALGVHLANEWQLRYGTVHGCMTTLEWLRANEPSLPDVAETPFIPSTHYRSEALFEIPGDPVATCRRFYAFWTVAFRSGPTTWPAGSRPPWIDEILNSEEPAMLAEILELLRDRRENTSRRMAKRHPTAQGEPKTRKASTEPSLSPRRQKLKKGGNHVNERKTTQSGPPRHQKVG